MVEECSEYEQGAYAVATEVECPEDNNFALDAVREDLEENGGQPQECVGEDNSTIVCQIGTSTVSGDSEDAGVSLEQLGNGF